MLGEMLADQPEREIRFLMGHYCHLLDAGEAMAWAALFTPDARWIRRNAAPAALGGSGISAGEVRGRAALSELAATSVMTNFRQLCRHQVTDLLLWRAASDDQAEGRCRMLITDWRDGPGRIAMAGIYDLHFTRGDGPGAGGWRISRLEAAFLPQ